MQNIFKLNSGNFLVNIVIFLEVLISLVIVVFLSVFLILILKRRFAIEKSKQKVNARKIKRFGITLARKYGMSKEEVIYCIEEGLVEKPLSLPSGLLYLTLHDEVVLKRSVYLLRKGKEIDYIRLYLGIGTPYEYGKKAGLYGIELQDWLYQHLDNIRDEASQLHLLKLREEYRIYSQGRYTVEYEPDWYKLRQKVFKDSEYKFAVCGNKAFHVHHRSYNLKLSGDNSHLLSLCNMCHYFIHPMTSMTIEAFKQNDGSITKDLWHP
jgi:hypothetical protein